MSTHSDNSIEEISPDDVENGGARSRSTSTSSLQFTDSTPIATENPPINDNVERQDLADASTATVTKNQYRRPAETNQSETLVPSREMQGPPRPPPSLVANVSIESLPSIKRNTVQMPPPSLIRHGVAPGAYRMPVLGSQSVEESDTQDDVDEDVMVLESQNSLGTTVLTTAPSLGLNSSMQLATTATESMGSNLPGIQLDPATGQYIAEAQLVEDKSEHPPVNAEFAIVEAEQFLPVHKQRKCQILAIIICFLVFGALGGGIYAATTNQGGSETIVHVTNAPTVTPSAAPSINPTPASPSMPPTQHPSVAPSRAPTGLPSATPSIAPTNIASSAPTDLPTSSPSRAPSSIPSTQPTASPLTENAQLADAIRDWVRGGESRTLVQEKYGTEIGHWDVSSVSDFSFVFSNVQFNDDISTWDVSRGTNFAYMFQNNRIFSQDVRTSPSPNRKLSQTWSMSQAQNFEGMFLDSSSFNTPIGSWDTSKVTSMKAMFSGALSFNQDLSQWDVSAVTDVSSMFNGAIAFNQNLCPWTLLMRQTLDLTGAMFSGSGCLYTQSPEFLEGVGWRFMCADVCRETPQPTPAPSPIPPSGPGPGPGPPSAGSCTEVELVIFTDDHPDEYSMEVTGGPGDILEVFGPWNDLPRRLFKRTLCLPRGMYDFETFDDTGDGLLAPGFAYVIQENGCVIMESGGGLGYDDDLDGLGWGWGLVEIQIPAPNRECIEFVEYPFAM